MTRGFRQWGESSKKIGYAIGKKTSLRDRHIASATIAAKPGVGIFNVGKQMQKKIQGTPGMNRIHHVTRISELATGQESRRSS